MCGRYTYYPGEFHNLRIPFKIGDPFFQFKQHFNIAPTQDAPVIVPSETGKVLKMLRWGLIPSWSKRPKGMFKSAFSYWREIKVGMARLLRIEYPVTDRCFVAGIKRSSLRRKSISYRWSGIFIKILWGTCETVIGELSLFIDEGASSEKEAASARVRRIEDTLTKSKKRTWALSRSTFTN
jgi:hypothetical protein